MAGFVRLTLLMNVVKSGARCVGQLLDRNFGLQACHRAIKYALVDRTLYHRKRELEWLKLEGA